VVVSAFVLLICHIIVSATQIRFSERRRQEEELQGRCRRRKIRTDLQPSDKVPQEGHVPQEEDAKEHLFRPVQDIAQSERDVVYINMMVRVKIERKNRGFFG
jgi:hypothetical protein